jgi:hypothetical protein
MTREQARDLVVQEIVGLCLATFVADEREPGLYPSISPSDWAQIHQAVADMGNPSDRDLDEALDVLAQKEVGR